MEMELYQEAAMHIQQWFRKQSSFHREAEIAEKSSIQAILAKLDVLPEHKLETVLSKFMDETTHDLQQLLTSMSQRARNQLQHELAEARSEAEGSDGSLGGPGSVCGMCEQRECCCGESDQ